MSSYTWEVDWNSRIVESELLLELIRRHWRINVVLLEAGRLALNSCC